MNLFSTQNLVGDHIDGLLREADAARLARQTRRSGDLAPAPASWRRLLGRGARGISFALGAASTRLDPTLDRSQRGERRPLHA